MQRTMKKTFSFVLALALVFTMCIGVFSTQAQAAAGDQTNLQIQVTDNSGDKTTLEGYEYTAYQIFSGDYAEDGTLSNITWGSDIIPGNITDDVADSLASLFAPYGVDVSDWDGAYLQSAEGAKALAAALGNITSNTADAKSFATIISACINPNGGTKSDTTGADGIATIEDLADGYYLVETTTVPDGDSAYSDYILVTVGGGETVGPIEDKEDVTHSDKTVDDVNDSDLSDDGANIKDGKSADYDIGDMVPFTLKGYVSQNYADFATTEIPYETTFHDVMTDGLTFDVSTVKVYIVHGTTETEISSDYYTLVTNPSDDCTFELTVPDFNAVLTAYGITDFDATTDYIKVTFSAELNDSALIGNAKGTDSTEDGYYGDGEFGNMNKSWIDFSNDAHNSDHKGTTAEVEVQVFTYTVIVNKYGDTTEVPLDGAEFTLEKLIDDGGSDSFMGYTGTWTDWDKVEVDNAGGSVFTWKGIDDGVYRISETVTPDGYNTADDIYMVVTATHTAVDGGDGYKTTLTVTTYDKDGNVISASDGAFNVKGDSGEESGTITGDIIDLSGSVLPSTGGIGTYIFYIIGGAIVVCAVVVLVTRRRMRRAA